jgi:hypothetical protein
MIITEETKRAFLTWRERPDVFLKVCFGVELWPKQLEILQAVAAGEKRIAVRAANDVGKSFALACLALWFLYAFPPNAVVTTAPTWNQVTVILWREIAKLWERRRFSSDAESLKTQLRVTSDQFAMGLATDETERFQGFRERNSLFIVDEASGVDEGIIEAIEGSLQGSGAHLVMVGNPTRTSGPLWNAFHGRQSALYKKMHISAFDYINYVKSGGRYIAPLVTEADIEEKRLLWGEDSVLWAVRVLGEFPREPEGTIIPLWAVERARQVSLEPSGEKEFGIDVADVGSNETVVVCRQGDVVLWLEAWRGRPSGETWGKVVQLIERDRPARVKVDYPGVGVGLYTHLLEMRRARGWKTEIIKIEPGAKAQDQDRYLLVADELWYTLADRFREGRIDLTRLSERDYSILSAQLTARMGKLDAFGRQRVESKSKLSESPDRADALALAFYSAKQSWSMLEYYLAL